jgi:NTE family protein
VPTTRPRPSAPSPRVGLVLGAGGVVGQAYEAGVLLALATDLGWDPRTADVIVGTSAGALTGALLRLGVAAEDLSAWAIDAPLSADARHLHDALDDGRRDLPAFAWSDLLRAWRPPPPALLARTLRRPWRFRTAVAAMTMMPGGRHDIEERCGPLDDIGEDEWPEGLWLCAARRDDGGRVVFGRPGSPPARLSQAVAASCGIPGFFRPVRIGDREYVDGGVHSGTNADVLVRADVDLVIAVVPMSLAGGRAWAPDLAMRRAAHRRLERELRPLRARGVTVVRIEPGADVLRAMGLNLMAEDRAARVVQAALFDAGSRIADPVVRERLAGVGDRSSAA